MQKSIPTVFNFSDYRRFFMHQITIPMVIKKMTPIGNAMAIMVFVL